MSVHILVADDHPVVRRGVGMILRADPKLAVVAEAEDGAEALTMGLQPEIDLAILDLAMPRLTGLEVAQQLVSNRPRLKILILSMYDDPRYVNRARKVGAHGYLLKSTVDRELLSACHTVLAGGAFVEPQVAERPPIEPPREIENGTLTARETQIVALIAAGNTSREIADQLTISTKTVERHRDNLMAKLDIHNRAELTRYAIRHGISEA